MEDGGVMLRWLRSLFAWRTVEDTGVHLYQRNAVTGRRRIMRCGRGGYQPTDMTWLETGEWDRPSLPGQPIDIGGGSVGVSLCSRSRSPAWKLGGLPR